MKLAIEGLKGADRNVELAKLNLALGPVGSGKSTLLDALTIVACGYVPRLGKTNAATAALMRNGQATVTLSTDGDIYSRSLLRNGESVASTASVASMPRARTTAAGEAIMAQFGGAEASENIDLRQFLQCTPSERAQRIERLLDATGISVEEAVLRVSAIAMLRLADVDPSRMPSDPKDLVAAAAGAKAMLPGPVGRRVGALVAAAEAQLRTTHLAAALHWANERKREAAKASKDKLAARKELEDRSISAEKDAAVRKVEDIRRDRDAVISERAAASAQKANAGRASAHRFGLEQKRDALTKLIATADEAHKVAMLAMANVEILHAQSSAIVDPDEISPPEMVPSSPEVAELHRQADAIVDPEAVPVVELLTYVESAERIALVDEATALEAEARSIDATMPTRLNALAEVAAVHAAERALELAKRSPWREVEAIATDLEGYGFECQGGPLKNAAPFQRLRALAAEQGGNLAEYESNVAKAIEAREAAIGVVLARESEISALESRAKELRANAEAKRAEAAKMHAEQMAIIAEANTARKAERQAKVDAYNESLAKARSERGELRKRALAMESDITAKNRAAREAYQAAVAERTNKVTSNAAERDALKARADRIIADAQQAQATLDAHRSDLAAIDAEFAGMTVVTVDVASCEAIIKECDAKLADLNAEMKLAEEADARRREMQALVDEIEAAQADTEIFTALEWALKRVRELDINARSSGLVERMTRFLRGAGWTETPYVEVDSGTCSFGVMRGHARIDISALSGGEVTLFSAALASAIIALRKPPIRCLLVEAAELGSGGPVQALLRGIESVAEDLDLVIVATNADVGVVGSSWSVHRSEACAVASS